MKSRRVMANALLVCCILCILMASSHWHLLTVIGIVLFVARSWYLIDCYHIRVC